MKKLIVVCALVALASPALYAQSTPGQQPTREQSPLGSPQQLQQNMDRMQKEHFEDHITGERQAFVNSLGNLTKLRAKLVEAWQALGMAPEAARTVAAAYQPNFALNARRASLQGRSDQEIAAMLQSALAKKDYLLANQTLIDYERNKLKLGTDVSPDGSN
jgi:hypothetical protein